MTTVQVCIQQMTSCRLYASTNLLHCVGDLYDMGGEGGTVCSKDRVHFLFMAAQMQAPREDGFAIDAEEYGFGDDAAAEGATDEGYLKFGEDE